jgi:hypothetical protein
MIKKPINLSPEESHAVEDLTLYTVNTRELYPFAQRIMHGLKTRNLKSYNATEVHPWWVGHAKRGHRYYENEMGACTHTAIMRADHVLRVAAWQIADHYEDELKELEQ